MGLLIDSKNGRVSLSHNDKGSESVVILAHGYLSDKNSRTNQALSEKLNNAGISTISFDLYGHGESEGDVEHLTISKAVESELAVYDFAKSKYDKIGLVGSSFTGSVSLITASKRDPAAIALKCPVFLPIALWNWRMGKEGVRKWKEEGFISPFGRRWSYDAYEDALQYNMPEIASGITAPTLVVHGDKDVTVPLSHAENLAFSLKGEKRLVVIEGADHFFKEPKHFEMMVNRISEWMIDILGD